MHDFLLLAQWLPPYYFQFQYFLSRYMCYKKNWHQKPGASLWTMYHGPYSHFYAVICQAAGQQTTTLYKYL